MIAEAAVSPGGRVFTISPGVPFLPTLADALLDGRLIGDAGEARLVDATLYLPTRRAAQALSWIIAERRGARSLFLPRILPLAEAEDAAFDLSDGVEAGFMPLEALAPPLAPLERRLIFTRLIQRWVEAVDRGLLRHPTETPLLVPSSPADAVRLAADLEALMDAFALEDVPWDELAEAVETDYSAYFRVTLEFVRIAAERWPAILKERGASDPAWRRSALVAAEARRLLRDRPRAPVIIAGSTGSLPSTAALIAAVAQLPNGAVVLPGLDCDLDERGWRAVAAVSDGGDLVHGHPQAMLRRLVDQHLKCKRSDIPALGDATEAACARARLLSEALRPADTTDAWSRMDPAERQRIVDQGAEGLALVEALDEREEALAIAIALREALETPGRTAALVTPDRTLAARVAAELTRWGIAAEDSAGTSLSDAPAGRLARLAVDAAAQDFEPTQVLALLAHPEVRLGLARAEVERAAHVLEIGVLRGPAPAPGLNGLAEALEANRGVIDRHAPRARRRLTLDDWERAAGLVERLKQAFGLFTLEAQGKEALDLVALSGRHREAVEALRQGADEEVDDLDGSHDDLDRLFDDLSLCDAGTVAGRFVDYRDFFAALAGERTVQAARGDLHPRIIILGLLEARLLVFDRVVVGGLDEGVWPPRPQTDCLLNRPMRARLGLSPPERRIGQTAHDFVQTLGTQDVVITRAMKRDGSPMVPSRFLQRIKAFIGEGAWARLSAAGGRYRRLARLIDTPPPAPPLPRPAPRPDPVLFPRTLSVTEIETLVRDPYAIFARHILKLDRLEPIAAEPTAPERGTLIHDILAGFTADYPKVLPAGALVDLLQRGQDKFGPIGDVFPQLYAAWWPRFVRMASAFVSWEEERRREALEILPEVSGALRLALPDGTTFTLRARADRIETLRDGGHAIIDFKTGAPPTDREVFAGFAPQLTLEAVMLMRGAFLGPSAAIGPPELIYVHTAGGRKPLHPRPLAPPKDSGTTVSDLIAEHERRFEALIAAYARGERAYLSRPYPKYARRYSDYDHLARVKEWSLTGRGRRGGRRMSLHPSDEAFVIPSKTLHDQRRAADPRASAWVAANAGAGKTKVLTDRVVRLLLAGAPPGRILCLTFTKAAAANMALRVFERLGRWVTLDEARLRDELTVLEGAPPTPEQMRMARCLFARSVETPGGLKIETIHAFCERILHLVPFEANVPARFAVLDEGQAAELAAEGTAAVLGAATAGERPDLRVALDTIGAEGLDVLSAPIREAIKAVARVGSASPGAMLERLAQELGLKPGETPTAIERAMLEDGLPAPRWRELAAMLSTGKPTDRKQAAALVAAHDAADPQERLQHYLSVFLTKEEAPRAAIVTKAIDEVLRQELIDEQDRLVALVERRRAARTIVRTAALYAIADVICAEIEGIKARLGALDFEDLIAKTLVLLARGDAAWVLYKLDRGIDHILIDEAQDTSPEQWAILRLITEDFTAGVGARGRARRTLFAVGDPKQSIYSFQGAAPQEFDLGRRHWATKLEAAQLGFEDVRLDLSFRSATAVLTAVDATFSVASHFKGLSYEDAAQGTAHVSARPKAPGRVELWPTVRPEEEGDPDAWTEPVDEPARTAPPVVLARRIAAAVKVWTSQGDEDGRVWRAGDMLILVRKRGPAFEAVIRALKEVGVPVAGADRIDIGAHIAVLDLVAAGRSALLPDDDLTVATALKSPLVGLTDDDLVRIAARRDDAESFVAALERHAAAGDPAARRGSEALAAWRELARRHGPFSFYATLLGPYEGRARLVARLGSEAGDAIDAFLCYAHAAERIDTPSLTTFLARFESASHPIKRDLDSQRDEVRVMTVHGAKGLEAPVVILIDGCDVLGRDPPLIPVSLPGLAHPLPVWSPAKDHDCRVVADARAAWRAKQIEEHNRLLYVAMTRAKDRLVIAPFSGNAKETPEQAWCEMVRRGFAARTHALTPRETPYGVVDLWQDGAGRGAGLSAAALGSAPVEAPLDAPPWLSVPVASEARPERPLQPSRAVPSRSRPIGERDARWRGVLVHTLLERLPGVAPERRTSVARAFLAARAPKLSAASSDRIIADALQVMDHAALAPLFAPDARAEAAITGVLLLEGRERRVTGRIDRLVVRDGTVLAADFKTGRPPVPGEPVRSDHAGQLALYGVLLRDIYSDHAVRLFVVWTAGPLIQELSPSELAAALDPIKAP